MSTPLSFCDISARYGHAPAAQRSIEEQTGWNPRQIFTDYLQKVQEQRKKDAKEDKEDALMAMIDAMNAPREDREAGRTDMTGAESLVKASKAIIEQYDGAVDPMRTLEIQALLSCMGDRFVYEEMDELQEQQQSEEERLEVTEEREPGKPGDPSQFGKEV